MRLFSKHGFHSLVRSTFLNRSLSLTSKQQIQHIQLHNNSSNYHNLEPLSWSLCASVLLERSPLLVPPQTDLESRMLKTLRQLDEERSLQSLHEIRKEEDELWLKETKNSSSSNVLESRKLAVDDEDGWKKELSQFTPASVKTSEEGNHLSMNRELHRPLRLLLQDNTSGIWTLPFAQRTSDETSLKQTAIRALETYFEFETNGILIPSNAPSGYYKMKFSKRIRGETKQIGRKVFIYKGYIERGSIRLKSKTHSYSWSLFEELEKYLTSQEFKAISEFTWDEN